ncbi:MAG: SDR family NAD(P)-dependent oxidoreductase [Chloroflexia bacterium]|nr:SDR family NAD(P)-dependent oxidoreductase [Chloroflexia bacterium]
MVELDAGRGIGRAIAERFAAGGAAVGLVARSRDEVDHAAAGITDRGGNALAVVANVPDHGQVPEAAGQVSSALGPIDVLVNDAGIDDPMAFVDSSLDRWDQTIRVNLYGAIHVCHLVARDMVIGHRGGSIINVPAVHGYRVEP